MKKMTCNQLGGACDLVFEANSFDEISKLSKAHGMEMFQKGDQPHLDAMNKMKQLMQTPGAVEKWFADKQTEFDEL